MQRDSETQREGQTTLSDEGERPEIKVATEIQRWRDEEIERDRETKQNKTDTNRDPDRSRNRQT